MFTSAITFFKKKMWVITKAKQITEQLFSDSAALSQQK